MVGSTRKKRDIDQHLHENSHSGTYRYTRPIPWTDTQYRTLCFCNIQAGPSCTFIELPPALHLPSTAPPRPLCLHNTLCRRVARLAIGGFPDWPIWDERLQSSRRYRGVARIFLPSASKALSWYLAHAKGVEPCAELTNRTAYHRDPSLP